MAARATNTLLAFRLIDPFGGRERLQQDLLSDAADADRRVLRSVPDEVRYASGRAARRASGTFGESGRGYTCRDVGVDTCQGDPARKTRT